ncbi:hypothetical protein ACJX0J_036198, partial [Zea mays]
KAMDWYLVSKTLIMIAQLAILTNMVGCDSEYIDITIVQFLLESLCANKSITWFSATRHYSRVAVTKNQKYPGENTTENNSSAIFDGIQVIEPNFGLIDKPDADTNDMISENSRENVYKFYNREVGPPGYQQGVCEQGILFLVQTLTFGMLFNFIMCLVSFALFYLLVQIYILNKWQLLKETVWTLM